MTDTELAILSLIVEKSRHGYDIERVIAERDMREWTAIGFSSIYYVLKQLEKKSWVETILVPNDRQGPARKVYHLTADGWVAWCQATLDALATPPPHHDAFQLGLSAIPSLPDFQVLKALRARRATLALTPRPTSRRCSSSA
jgi:DNA-binding PadR family transcriptional regulator